MPPFTPEFSGVVRFTRIGTGYLVFTMIIGFAAINSGNNSLYIALSFMLAGLLISGVASRSGLRQVEVQFLRLDEAWAGTPASGILVVLNRSRIWNVRDVVLTSPELESPLFFSELPRRGSVQLVGSFLFTRRGKVELKSANLYTRYPFGLFLKKRRVSLRGEAIIYPRLLDEKLIDEGRARLRGEHGHANQIGPGSDIRSFREYVPGDSLRHIHWKKSASTGRWIIKQTELESNRAVDVAVDPLLPEGATAEEFERMISEAATYIRNAIDSRMEVSLHLPAGSIRGGGYSVRRPMFEALALLNPSSEGWAEWLDPDTIVFSLRERREPRSA